VIGYHAHSAVTTHTTAMSLGTPYLIRCYTDGDVLFQICKQLNVLASSSLNIGFTKADRLHAVIQREVQSI